MASDNTFTYVAGVFFALVAVVVTFLKWRFSFWKRVGIPCVSSPIEGLQDILLKKKSIGEYIASNYEEAKAKHLRHTGAFLFINPTYVPIDLEIVKHILVKDFSNFMNRGVYFNEKQDPLSAHLFSIEDEFWKSLRQKLSPTFTSGQIKTMFPTLASNGEKFREYMKRFSDVEAIDIKDILARLTTDMIGSCAFGIECNSLENPDAEFRKYGRMVFEGNYIQLLKGIVEMGLPRELLRFLRHSAFQKEVSSFFIKAVKDTVEYREKNNIHRKDFMHLLLQLKNHGGLSEDAKKDKSDFITMDELAAQAFVFYLGGFETSSTAMTFALYELSLHQDIQDKLRNEIHTVLSRHGNELTYEGVMEMQYMQQVLEETLRMHSPAPFLDRQCKNDYKIPGTDVILPRNTHVTISVYGLHYDPEYYPDPKKFDPERFSEENKSKRPPYTYLPFGDGPRICIGMRFGILQAKVGLASLLRDYRISLHEKTSVPLIIDKESFVTSAKGGVWIRIHKI